MSGPSFHIRLPPLSIFKFPPDPQPPALPPPPNAHTFASPFTIDAKLYNDALSVWVPIGVSAFYFTMVTLWNAVNRRRSHKPFAFSQTRVFKALVILHNVFLALFSALTFVAMMRALRHTWPGRIDRYDRILGIPWPAFRTENGLAGAADALCHMHGPRGLGNAALYVPETEAWEMRSGKFQLAGTGTPDPTDVGRLWNEGLAFWGWWFYLSKFYEVFDTIIILLKGKRSSTLQTYHHAGAMWCMWAGIRYMSSPIWMFAWMNSLIHALMYTYYTAAALGVRVPQVVKRTLTTAQISQFLLGFTFAAAHLFVSYTVPVSTPYNITTKVLSAASQAAEAASTAVSEHLQPTMTAGIFDLLKKIALRAAGEEGLAENVRNAAGERFGPEAAAYERWENVTKTLYRDEWHEVPCIDTTGQSFAIWLNLIYLLPLTALFVRFFVRSYSRRTAVASRSQQPKLVKDKAKAKAQAAREATKDAAADVEDRVENVGRELEREAERVIDRMERSGSPTKVREMAGKFEKKVQGAVDSLAPDGNSPVVRKVRSQSKLVQEKANQILANGKNVAEDVKNKGVDALEAIEKKGQELADKVMAGGWDGKKKMDESWDMLESKVLEGKEEVENKIAESTEGVKSVAQETAEKAKDVKKEVKKEAKEAEKPKSTEKAKDVKNEAKEEVKDAEKPKAAENPKDVKKEAKEETKDAEKPKTAEEAKDVKKEAKEEAKDVEKPKPAEKPKSADKPKNVKKDSKKDVKAAEKKTNEETNKPKESVKEEKKAGKEEFKEEAKDLREKIEEEAKKDEKNIEKPISEEVTKPNDKVEEEPKPLDKEFVDEAKQLREKVQEEANDSTQTATDKNPADSGSKKEKSEEAPKKEAAEPVVEKESKLEHKRGDSKVEPEHVHEAQEQAKEEKSDYDPEKYCKPEAEGDKSEKSKDESPENGNADPAEEVAQEPMWGDKSSVDAAS